MSQKSRKVLPFEPVADPPALAAGGGDGDGTDARLREIDSRLRDVEKDIVEIKTKLEPLATREDVYRMLEKLTDKQETKVKWLIGIMVTAFGIMVTVLGLVIHAFVNLPK